MANFKNVLLFIVLFIPLFSTAQLTYPTRYPNAVIQHTGNDIILFFGYAPMIYQPAYGGGIDTFKLFYINTGIRSKYSRLLARSTNYGITWTDTHYVNVDVDTNHLYKAVVEGNESKLYMGYNRWIPDSGPGKKSYMCKAYSTNGGYKFTDTGVVMQLGEDKSFLWNEDTDEYCGYVRPRNVEPVCSAKVGGIYVSNGVRKIALMKNNSIFPTAGNWSARDTIVEIDPSDYINSASPDYRTQVYYMQVFRSGSDWWGLVGMYRIGNNGEEVKPFPYTHPEYTSDVELMWSDDGEDWYRTNNRQPIIPLHDSIKTIYSVGTLVGDSVYIYSCESTILHAEYRITDGCSGTRQDTAYKGKFYSMYLYKMSVAKLNEWRPPSIVYVTAGVEGFINTGTGKHVLKDTLTAELRSTSSPYNLESTVKAVIDSSSLTGKFDFPHVSPGSYYLVLEGRNSLETWSSSGISIVNSTSASYDFTVASTRA
ncbi:MAG: hypothetical protein SGI89_06710 [bacterium]|nr:hypothetical protein [bacterium]